MRGMSSKELDGAHMMLALALVLSVTIKCKHISTILAELCHRLPMNLRGHTVRLLASSTSSRYPTMYANHSLIVVQRWRNKW